MNLSLAYWYNFKQKSDDGETIIIETIIIVCIFIARANKTIGISDLFFSAGS